ncbi:MAG: hypothetical protein EOM83_14275 [Clostridia bacterium]|nr:hypothetical protein [Clostridia bacterium]
MFRFDYFPFVVSLLRRGYFRWNTECTDKALALQTTFYLQGDFLCFFILSQGRQVGDFSDEDFQKHITKINRDMAGLTTFVNHIGFLIVAAIAGGSFLMNPERVVLNIIITTVSAAALVAFRKYFKIVINKALGALLGLVVRKYF